VVTGRDAPPQDPPDRRLPGHDWIAARIPHAGAMCLLDSVLQWDETRVRCRATSHRSADNPLRAQGSLATPCGVEYAAQAMAVHAALLAPEGGRPAAGFLASVREARWSVERLDDIAGDLEIEAERISGADAGVLYSFALRSGGRLLLEGRAGVILDAGSA
jgi:predicted hotdog family 3-hydroxylacyl-ACP dehydratase